MNSYSSGLPLKTRSHQRSKSSFVGFFGAWCFCAEIPSPQKNLEPKIGIFVRFSMFLSEWCIYVYFIDIMYMIFMTCVYLCSEMEDNHRYTHQACTALIAIS